jgi:glycosyltransferase involved in cell wall biosynthesis
MRGVEGVEWIEGNQRFLEMAARIIAVSKAVAQSLTSGGVSPEKIAVVYDGVDMSTLARRISDRRNDPDTPFERIQGKKLVGIVGRVVSLKGIADFVRAAASISPANPEVAFVVVGNGPEEYVQEMKQLALNLGISKQLEFVGYCQDVVEVMSHLDVLVLATFDRESSREEACPNVVLEAMASRTPVVATRSGGVMELLDNGRGVTVSPGDEADLARGILRVLSMKDDERQVMLDRAYRTVEKQFTIQEQSRRIQGLYAEVLEEQRPL